MRSIPRPYLHWLLILAIVLSALTPRMHDMALPKWMTLGQDDLCTTQAETRNKPVQPGEPHPSHACECLHCSIHTAGDLPLQTNSLSIPRLAQPAVLAARTTPIDVSALQWPPGQPRAPPLFA